MKSFVIITDIIPINYKNERVCSFQIIPVLLAITSFRKFYDLKLNLIKKEYEQVCRLDFFYIEIFSSYLN
jgi:hypothetical protein